MNRRAPAEISRLCLEKLCNSRLLRALFALIRAISSTHMHIGEVSKITGVSIKAIRLYEEKGLLPDIVRSGKYRVYNQGHIQLIALIKEAKALGFKLSEMKSALDAGLEDNIWRSILHAIRCKKLAIKQEIIRLDGIVATLTKHEQSIDSCLSENPDCDLSP